MLIPMFIIIGVWGGPRRVYAAMKFFLYTFLGSVFMLVGLIYMYMKRGSWQIPDLVQLPLTATEQMWLLFAFFHDRKNVVAGKRGTVRVALAGSGRLTKKKTK